MQLPLQTAVMLRADARLLWAQSEIRSSGRRCVNVYEELRFLTWVLCKFKKFWFSCPFQFKSSQSKISFLLPLAGFALKFNLGPRICLARQDIYLHRKRPKSQTDSCELAPSFMSSTKVFKPSLWRPGQALGGALWKDKVDSALELMDLICLKSRLLSGVARLYNTSCCSPVPQYPQSEEGKCLSG